MQTELALGETMTVAELSETLNVPESTIRDTVKRIKNDYPFLFMARLSTGPGRPKYAFDEQECSIISRELKKAHNAKQPEIRNANTTRLERAETVALAMQYINDELQEAKAENERLKSENAIMAPKAALADIAIRDETEHYSITQAGKHLGIRQSEMFHILESKHLIDKERLPTQKAIDGRVLQLRTNPSINGRNRPQAIMTMENIFNFKERYLR